MLFLVASEKKQKNPDFELACTMPFCHVSHTQMTSVIFILGNPEIRSVTPLKLSPLSLGLLERCMPFQVKSACFVQLIVWLVT